MNPKEAKYKVHLQTEEVHDSDFDLELVRQAEWENKVRRYVALALGCLLAIAVILLLGLR